MVFVALQLLKHVALAETLPHSSTCINRLLEHNQSLKLVLSQLGLKLLSS